MSESVRATGGDLAIGVFDGVHRGHQHLIDRMVSHARESGLYAVCVTFEPDPDAVLHPDRSPATLSTAQERSDLLAALGVQWVDTLAFTPELAHQTPLEFVGWLHRTYPFRALWVGSDFALGRDRAGTVEVLMEIGRSLGFEVVVVDPLLEGDRPISSTWIRGLLREGDLDRVGRLLGRPYCLHGAVIEGARRGHQLGFPTANVLPPPSRALPPDGVYFVQVEVGGAEQPGVANLGSRPTFSENQRLLETHLLDFAGDLYGTSIGVCFVEQLRSTQRFESVDALRAQIERDVELARAKAAEYRPRAPSTGA